ncbi:hypothetical protein LTS18_001849 [Coniosporium uncinatum]|uniref:Uncharacterized protein n=1 Tax=Coniosporium uncinatum TaxID=93489 RepID=A0ACC3D7X9_9PEZI|nr:hypothetical protein LTS18_001849 [Coniosporium uncinatum]
MSLLTFAVLAATAAAHGTVSGIVADGTYYLGYNPSFQYQNPPPTVVGWSIPEDQDNGFVAPFSYTDPDIICHKSATPGGTSATIKAGGTVDFQWTTWPESHKGPVIGYMANCHGDCTSVDKTSLQWVKVEESGLVDGSTTLGQWASDKLIANNNTWSHIIPSAIAPGHYVFRHEIIALHSASDAGGAQNYPQCVNLEVTGSGTDDLASGTLGTALYKPDDAGIKIGIYQPLSSYAVPGPALMFGTGSGTDENASVPAEPSSAAMTSAPATSTAGSTSKAVSSLSAATSNAAGSNDEVAEPSSTPEAGSSAAPSRISANTNSDTQTSTVYVTATAAPTSLMLTGLIPSITAAIPTSVATAEITALPSAIGVPVPGANLPNGFTVKDLLEWLKYVMTAMFKSRGASGEVGLGRTHSRDIGVAA